MGPVLEFRALGPLVVLRDGEPVELGKGTERALVALLVLRAGDSLSPDAIIDALWGERPPPTAREMVRNYVARARKRLGEDAISTSGTGYRLNVPANAVDWLCFTSLATEGARALEAGDAEHALAQLEQGLALWRGRPLPELDITAAGRRDVASLEELRLRAIEDRAEAELALGRSGTLVPELEQLVQEHPYRERLRGQLMLALYRCGRQKDALDRYQEGRRILVEEVGLEPSPELQQLHLAILRHDPSLDAHSRGDPSPGEPVTRPPARRRRGLMILGAAIVVAAVVVPIVLLAGGSSKVVLSGQSLAELDARSGAVVGSLRLDRTPGPLALTPAAVWVGAAVHPSATAVESRRMRTLGSVELSATPYALAAGDGMVWVANGFYGTLTRVAGRGRVSGPFRTEPQARGRMPLAYGFGSLWAGSQDGALSRVDPLSDRTVAVVHMPKPDAIAVGDGSVWVAEDARDGVVRIDPRVNRVVREIPVGGLATGIAVGDGGVWVATPAEGEVWRIDPRQGDVTASIDVGGQPESIVATNGAVWVVTPDGILTKIDPRTNRIVETIALNRPVGALASGNGRLWLTLP